MIFFRNFADFMRYITLLLLSAVFLLNACNTQDKVLKNKDVNERLNIATQYYEQGKWVKSNEIYERLLPIFRGTKNFEEIYYRYCYTFYNMKDYLSASYQFKNFMDLFPKSEYAEEINFMYATSLYKMSPRGDLDQTNTMKAIDALQSFINSYPNSKNATIAANYIEVGRNKLETKQKKAAQLYYDMQEYKAASTAFKAMIQAFPESRENEYYQYMVIRSFAKYADLSNKSKQEERYAEAIAAFADLKEYYPNSKYIKEAQTIIASAQKRINQLRNENK